MLIFNNLTFSHLRLSSIAVVAGAVGLFGVEAPAQAVVINFNPLGASDGLNHTIEQIIGVSPAPDITVGGTLYSESGFSLRSTGGDRFSVHGENDALDGAGTGFVGSAAMFNSVENGIGETELTKDGGGPFDLNSIDLFANQETPGTISVEFIGTKSNTDVVTRSFSFDFDGSDFSAHNVDFSSDDFTDLVEVNWVNSVGAIGVHQFDNIDVTEFIDNSGQNGDPVPEPGTLALLSCGLLCLGILARRRRLHL